MEEIVLSQSQQQIILKTWNDAVEQKSPAPSISAIIEKAFPDVENADGRTKEG